MARGNSVPGNRAAAGTYTPPNNPINSQFSARSVGRTNEVPGGGTRGANFEALRPKEDMSLMSGGRNEPPLKSLKGLTGPERDALPTPSQAQAFGFNIEKFKSQALGTYGILTNNLFLVTLYFPLKVGSSRNKLNPSKEELERIPLFCSACMLPSVTIGTQDIVARYGYDVVERMPGYVEFRDVPFTFMSDGKGHLINFFHDWVSYIVNFDDRYGMSTRSGVAGQFPYEVSYKDDYSAIIEITVYNQSADRIVSYALYEAFPKEVYNVNLSWRYTGEVAAFDVLMSFRNFTTNRFTEISDSSIQGLSLFQKIIKGATLAQTVSSVLKKPQSISDVVNIVGTAGTVYQNLDSFFKK